MVLRGPHNSAESTFLKEISVSVLFFELQHISSIAACAMMGASVMEGLGAWRWEVWGQEAALCHDGNSRSQVWCLTRQSGAGRSGANRAQPWPKALILKSQHQHVPQADMTRDEGTPEMPPYWAEHPRSHQPVQHGRWEPSMHPDSPQKPPLAPYGSHPFRSPHCAHTPRSLLSPNPL